MALEDSLRTFAKKPLGTKIAYFAGGLALVGLLYYQLFYSGMSDDLADLEQVNQTETQRNQQLKKREQQYKKLVKQRDELREQLIKNRESLPSSAELPSFFKHLQKQAANSGVNIVSWKRSREVPAGFYVKVPVSMTIAGTYYQILHYFKLLSETDRIITVESLKLGSAQQHGDETILKASFNASTFRKAGDGTDELFQGDDEEPDAENAGKSKTELAREKVEAERAKRMKEAAGKSNQPAEKPPGNGSANDAPAAGGTP